MLAVPITRFSLPHEAVSNILAPCRWINVKNHKERQGDETLWDIVCRRQSGCRHLWAGALHSLCSGLGETPQAQTGTQPEQSRPDAHLTWFLTQWAVQAVRGHPQGRCGAGALTGGLRFEACSLVWTTVPVRRHRGCWQLRPRTPCSAGSSQSRGVYVGNTMGPGLGGVGICGPWPESGCTPTRWQLMGSGPHGALSR